LIGKAEIDWKNGNRESAKAETGEKRKRGSRSPPDREVVSFFSFFPLFRFPDFRFSRP
jgi:hypothetical protein